MIYDSGERTLNVLITPRGLTRGLTLIVLSLTLASLAGVLSKHLLGHGRLGGFVGLFDFNADLTLPNWYSSLALLLSSLLLATIAVFKRKMRQPYGAHWLILSIIFLCLAIDEATAIHERTNGPLGAALNYPGGFLYYAWILLGAAFVFALALAYLRFLGHLPPATLRLFVTAAAFYVGGALGMEAIQGHHVDLYGKEDLTFSLIAIAEEVLEMTGVIVFVHALAAYMSSHVGDIRLRIGKG